MVALIPALIVIVVALIAGIILLAKFAKKVLKWVVIVGAVMLIVSIIFGVNVFSEIKQLQENFPTAQKIFLLNDAGTIRAGFIQDGEDVDFTSIDRSSASDYNKKYDSGELADPPAGTFIFILSSKVFQDAEVEVASSKISAEEALDIIRSGSPIDAALPVLVRSQGVPDTPETRELMRMQLKSGSGITSDQTMRNILFAQLVSASVKDFSSIIKHYQSGQITIYPNSLVFKLIKLVPAGLIESAAGG